MNFAIKAGFAFIGIAIGIAIGIPILLYYSWALWISWNWIIPEALGLQSLSLWQAVALSSIAWFVTQETKEQKKIEENIDVVKTLLQVILRPVSLLAVCWICKEYLI